MRTEARQLEDPGAGSVYLTREEIATRVAELGTEIGAVYTGRDLVVLAVLRGAFVFVSDLVRAIPVPHTQDFVALARYDGDGGRIRIMKDLDAPIRGRDVLVVENVVDTGLTLNYLLRELALREPSDLGVCTLLDRPFRRLVDDLPIRHVGFTVPDEFFVGYGFDFDGRYRGLPDLHTAR